MLHVHCVLLNDAVGCQGGPAVEEIVASSSMLLGCCALIAVPILIAVVQCCQCCVLLKHLLLIGDDVVMMLSSCLQLFLSRSLHTCDDRQPSAARRRRLPPAIHSAHCFAVLSAAGIIDASIP